jgi:hypothetical protein
VSRIEKLFADTAVVEISDSVKLRAAQRAIDKRPPFHRLRNGIDDAVLIEVFDSKETLVTGLMQISRTVSDPGAASTKRWMRFTRDC